MPAGRARAPRRSLAFRAAGRAPGGATVLVPCGVTLSTEAVAVSSGSAVGGAAVMAGFAAGTAPAFALLGMVLRRVAATRWRHWPGWPRWSRACG
ncbi:urease accessory protein UreH domain-containing protein, partial [Planomonospora algeriensis]